MREYDLFIPVKRRQSVELADLKRQLTKFFGGLTYFPQRNEGRWRLGRITYRDDIVILRVFATNALRAERFLKRMRRQIQRDFKQDEVLIVSRKVKLI